MSKIRLSEPAVTLPVSGKKNTLVVLTIAGLVCSCAALLIIVGVLAYFVMRGGGSDVDHGKVAVVAEAAHAQYAENMARVDEFMAQQVLDKKVKNKVTLSSQANAKGSAARMAAFEELNKLDNTTFPDDFAGHEQEVADYLKACAEGRREAVK